jgi:hypothetical protein
VIRRPSRIASAGSGIASITAAPIVLTSLPPLADISARTDREKSATSAAVSWSPCASVSAVKPAMSAKTKVASTLFGSPPLIVWMPPRLNPLGVCTFAQSDHNE